MESFLDSFGTEIVFQPFAHLSDFYRNLRSQRPAFQLLPAWHLDLYGRQLKLRPLLQPLRSGRRSYHKVLLARSDWQGDPDSLAGRSLALTPMGPRTASILDTVLFGEMAIHADRLDIVFVPKDYDALFALVLGQVDLALITKDNLDRIATRNPRLVNAIKTVHQTRPLPLPVICYTEGSVSNEVLARLNTLFQDRCSTEQCRTIMEMLHFDDWETVH